VINFRISKLKSQWGPDIEGNHGAPKFLASGCESNRATREPFSFNMTIRVASIGAYPDLAEAPAMRLSGKAYAVIDCCVRCIGLLRMTGAGEYSAPSSLVERTHSGLISACHLELLMSRAAALPIAQNKPGYPCKRRHLACLRSSRPVGSYRFEYA